MPDEQATNPLGTDETIRGSDVPLIGRCGSKLARTDPPRYCLQYPLKGLKRCKLHGGRSPRGVLSPNFKHGGRSHYIPERMRPDYEAALQDPEILSLRREIAAHRAQVNELRMRMETGEGGGAALQTAWRDFRTAHRAGDPERLADALARLEGAITARGAEDAVRKELRHETELLQKLTRAENDRLEQLHQMVSREQALTYMHALAVAVREAIEAHVGEGPVRAAVLRAVTTRFAQLDDRRGPAGADAPGGDLAEPVGAAAED